MKWSEKVQLRLYNMECCGHMLCWVNPRPPTHCPQCGKVVYPQVRGWAVVTEDAWLRVGEDSAAKEEDQ